MAPSTAVAPPGDEVPLKIDPKQTLKASKALLAHIKKTAQQNSAKAPKKNILDAADGEEPATVSETPIWLTLTTKRHIHDTKKLQPGKVALPYPLHTDPDSTICIIVADPQRAYKNMVASDEFPEDLRKRITRVIDLKHLTAKFSQYEAQRKLFAEHDIFLADDRVINRLPKALGRSFYKTTAKRPIPVSLQKRKVRENGKRVKRVKSTEEINARPVPEVAGEINKAMGSALVHLAPSTNTSVKIGYASMEPEQIAANVQAVAAALALKYVPKKKNGVRSIFIKGPSTVALPIWETSELWLDAEADVIANDSDLAKAVEAKREKANIGKKRKALDRPEEEVPKAKKTKQESLPESIDTNLDKEIAERKTRLRNQKKAARQAMDD